MVFFTVGDGEIRAGKTTDVYFINTKKALEKHGLDRKSVVAEFTADTFPQGYEWAVFCGLEEMINLLEGRDVDLYAMDEGTIFVNKDRKRVRVPVALLEGPYGSFCELETPALGFMCQSSGIATKAARMKKLAGEKTILSFGVRRMHPAIAPMIDRSAYIGGCDDVSSITGAEAIGKNPVGTMPHALMIMFGNESAAWRAFDEVADTETKRIVLIDTYLDEKAEAIEACSTLKERLYGLRLDTPSSRRGKMEDIVGELRWELALRGFKELKILVSGGIDEGGIIKLGDLVDGFGIGTSISGAPTINYAMDIVEKEGEPVAKRGKLGGKKQWFRCRGCFNFEVLPFGSEPPVCCGRDMEPMLRKFLERGVRTEAARKPHKIRDHVLEQLERAE